MDRSLPSVFQSKGVSSASACYIEEGLKPRIPPARQRGRFEPCFKGPRISATLLHLFYAQIARELAA